MSATVQEVVKTVDNGNVEFHTHPPTVNYVAPEFQFERGIIPKHIPHSIIRVEIYHPSDIEVPSLSCPKVSACVSVKLPLNFMGIFHARKLNFELRVILTALKSSSTITFYQPIEVSVYNPYPRSICKKRGEVLALLDIFPSNTPGDNYMALIRQSDEK